MSDPAPVSRLKAWIVPGIVLLALLALLIWWAPAIGRVFLDPQAIRSDLLQAGPWAPLVFVLLQVVQVVLFALPGEVVQIAGGWLFGFLGGSLLSVAGIALGSSLAFGLTRWLGVRFVHKIAGPKTVAKFDGLMASPQFIGSLFLLFLIPGIPKDVLCYVAGLASIKFIPFLLISTVARLPGIFGSSLIGKAFFESNWLLLALVAGGALVLFVVGWLFREPIFNVIERLAVKKNPEKASS
jgi:uncharacterized membrane protein YdjX (TVP38/TMEM64 family)